MAMKKADMEAHLRQYNSLISEARLAEREGLYSHAVKSALSSWDYIDGMMQYERRYNKKEFTNIAGIDMVLKYAPLLLDFGSIDTLESLLKDYRRIEKNTSESYTTKLSDARARMWEAHRLWDQIERNPESRQDKLRQAMGGEQEQWRSMTEAWEKMGLLRRTPEGGSYRLALSTRMGELVNAKCSACGEVVAGPKAMFFEQSSCPECRNSVMFVILATQAKAEAKG